MITITNFLGTPEVFSGRGVKARTVAIPTNSNTVYATKLQDLGVVGITAKAIGIELLRFLGTLEPPVRARGDFLDNCGNPHDLNTLRNAIGLGKDEHDAFLASLRLLRELKIVRLNGSDAAELDGRTYSENRVEMMESAFGDIVEKLYEKLPSASSTMLVPKHVFKALAELPEDQLPTETELIDAAERYQYSKDYFKALQDKPGEPSIVRVQNFIKEKYWKKRLVPAFLEQENLQMKCFLEAYPLDEFKNEDVLAFKVSIFYIQRKVTKALSLDILKTWVGGPWKIAKPPLPADYIKEELWKKTPPQSYQPTAATEDDLSAQSETVEVAQLPVLPSSLQALFDQAPEECSANSCPEKALEAWNLIPEEVMPSKSNLSSMIRSLTYSYIWTYKRVFPEAEINIPGVQELIKSRKWKVDSKSAFTLYEIEQLKARFTDPHELSVHDQIFKRALPDGGYCRVRDNGKKEYSRPSAFMLPLASNDSEILLPPASKRAIQITDPKYLPLTDVPRGSD